jgi:hypothetical protein
MELEGEQRKGRDISFAGFHRCWEESFPKIPLDLLANAILGLVQLEILYGGRVILVSRST